MADIVTGTVTGIVDTSVLMQDHSDIRREAAEHTNEIVREGLRTADKTNTDIKQAGWDTFKAVAAEADRIVGQSSAYFIAQQQADALTTRDIANLRAELAAGHAQLERATVADGGETRRLINELKVQDLNRALIERNTELVSERDRGYFWQGQFGNAQFAQLTSQVNALNSQMTETRQGMVNFGTMAGVGQSSTSNNVR